MTARATFIALNRFGLGARPSDWRTVNNDPSGWLYDQLAGASDSPQALTGLTPGHQRVAEFQEARRKGAKDIMRTLRQGFRKAYMIEAAARTRAQIESDRPFRERLVIFWSNHFTVSVRKPVLFALAGPFEREAIRPHVTGRFTDMLLAVVKHPAMLLYLDNARSIGPNSRFGRRRGKGLNENLAREILELHTLGVDSGYTQRDVTELARILTGWSIGRGGRLGGEAGRFAFYARAHEPGAKTLLQMRYPEGGIREGEAALADLARHPATAGYLATKLVRHFVADTPSPGAVKRIARVFRDTDGDLEAVARTLVDIHEAWTDPFAKVKSSNDFVVSTLRAIGFEGDDRKLVGSLQLLGQAPFAAPSPAGWPDTAAGWIGPESILRRAEWASAVGRRIGRRGVPERLFAATVGPVARWDTRLAVERAPSAGEAVALLLASPEFQRR